MNPLGLVIGFALRKKTRFAITSLAVGLTLVAFLVLRAVVDWYSVDAESARADRMIVRHKNSIFFPLYTSEAGKVAQVPGVTDVSWLCWFVGMYIDERHNFTQLAVESASYFRMYPEFRAPEDQMREYMADATGAIAGDVLVKKHGWKIGDRISIKGTIYPGDWQFTLRGVYTADSAGADRERFLFHWKYLNEKLPGGNHVQRFLVRVQEPSVAHAIDALFANSGTPTKTESEAEIQRQWASWSRGVVQALRAASSVVLFVLALVLANSMALATRESTREYAVMRAIGCRPRYIAALVVGEACVIGALGSAIALALAPGVLRVLTSLLSERLGGAWNLRLDMTILMTAVALGLGVSVVTSLSPGIRAGRLAIVEGLRRAA